jgi:hypothetical protein
MDEKHIAEIQQTLAMAYHYLNHREVARADPEFQVTGTLMERLKAAAKLLEQEVKKQ